MLGAAFVFLMKDEMPLRLQKTLLGFTSGVMVAFTYGSAVTTDTFDVCVEKADRHVGGAFAIINQQFAEHLPEQYVYLNREEDMGIPGLRQAKLSYHPEILLTYNVVHITKND